jgi:hypothetical protein
LEIDEFTKCIDWYVVAVFKSPEGYKYSTWYDIEDD